MADLGKAIRTSIDTGKARFGSRDAVKAALNGSAKVLVLSGNCPKGVRGDIKRYASLSSLPVIEFPGSSTELGSLCGKPFAISAIAVSDVGNSDLLDFVKEGRK